MLNWCNSWGHSRSRLHPERADFIVAPAHGLEGGIIIAKLTLTAQEVLTLKDGHTALSVVLQGGKCCFFHSDQKKLETANMIKEGKTYSTGNRPEWGQSLNVIGIAAPESITLGVLSPLQHKLLTLVGGVFITHPAVGKTRFWVNSQTVFSVYFSLLPFSLCTLKLFSFTVCLLTHAPLSTLRDRTVSKPNSITLQHSEVNSWRRPWKHSSSNTMIWK